MTLAMRALRSHRHLTVSQALGRIMSGMVYSFSSTFNSSLGPDAEFGRKATVRSKPDKDPAHVGIIPEVDDKSVTSKPPPPT